MKNSVCTLVAYQIINTNFNFLLLTAFIKGRIQNKKNIVGGGGIRYDGTTLQTIDLKTNLVSCSILNKNVAVYVRNKVKVCYYV
ncbi:hypothetical protein MOSE0_L00276 [Monosporozyma servazzii]